MPPTELLPPKWLYFVYLNLSIWGCFFFPAPPCVKSGWKLPSDALSEIFDMLFEFYENESMPLCVSLIAAGFALIDWFSGRVLSISLKSLK